MRIVSLLPSATEILCELGLGPELVGVSHECDYPAEVRGLPAVTRSTIDTDGSSRAIDDQVRDHLAGAQALYSLDRERMAELAPDLVVTQALCDVCAVAAEEVESVACSLPGSPRVLNLEPMSLAEVFATMDEVGQATGREAEAEAWKNRARQRIAEVEAVAANTEPQSLAFLEWIDPLFNAGHWTPELIEMAGGADCLGVPHQPSHQIEWQQLLDAQPQVLVIGLCGFNIDRTEQDMPILADTPGWRDLPAVQNGRVHVVDGNAYFNRPGPRLLDSLELLAHILHGDQFPLRPGITPPRRWPTQ